MKSGKKTNKNETPKIGLANFTRFAFHPRKDPEVQPTRPSLERKGNKTKHLNQEFAWEGGSGVNPVQRLRENGNKQTFNEEAAHPAGAPSWRGRGQKDTSQSRGGGPQKGSIRGVVVG